jgi:hypothetical protein
VILSITRTQSRAEQTREQVTAEQLSRSLADRGGAKQYDQFPLTCWSARSNAFRPQKAAKRADLTKHQKALSNHHRSRRSSHCSDAHLRTALNKIKKRQPSDHVGNNTREIRSVCAVRSRDALRLAIS